jgi:hypothetical protein
LTSLAKEIEKVVEENKDKKMAAVIQLLGEDREELEEKAKKISEPYKCVAFAVPVETEAGPKNYGVNPEAGVTVLVVNKRKIVANHAIAPGKLDKKKIKEIAEDAAESVADK